MAEIRTKIIAVCGPTASGKTRLSLDLAEVFDAEIISCDSMQIYRGMDIGTAKATNEEQKRVKHHLIDIADPGENYSTESYRCDAMAAVSDIQNRGKNIIFVGGTGLYLDTLMRGESKDVPPADKEYREKILSEIHGQEDVHALWQRLAEVDSESALQIHENNIRRVIRAIEIYEKTGKTKSYFDKLSLKSSASLDIKVAALCFNKRDILYERINKRVDEMLSSGLIDEVRGLYESGKLKEGTTAAQAIGYKELISYVKGECSLEHAEELIKLSSRRYAKRQETWFRHVDAFRIMLDEPDGSIRPYEEILNEAKEIITNNFTYERENEI